MVLPGIHVVLARPSEPRNVGATCRAVKNFGITRLTIVTEQALDFEAARPLATGAEDVLQAATVMTSLREAVAGDSLVAGVTRRLGQRRKARPYSPWEFAERAVTATDTATALVFGNEQSGLSDKELESCHVAVAIPTSPECPSLNLSHAVEVICYELYKASLLDRPGTDDLTAAHDLPTSEEIAAASDAIVGSLERLGYHSQDGPQGMRVFVRDLIARASLAREETTRFRDLFAKLAGMHGSERDS